MKPGDIIGHYVIEEHLAKGGMGEIYIARDERLGRRVALKCLRRDADRSATARLLREARAVAAFEHPNAVVIYDIGEHEGAPFIAMELVRGNTLRQLIDEDVPLARRLRWLIDAARALGAAHRAGLVHRDVKPDNIMVRDDGLVKILDFGLARRAAAPSAPPESVRDSRLRDPIGTLTDKGILVATPRYASPEQIRCEPLDGRADQFSWAVTAFELIAGVPPWLSDEGVRLLSKILSSEIPSLSLFEPSVPPEVERILTRALSKNRDDRFPTIDEAADELELYAESPSGDRLSAISRVPVPSTLVAPPSPPTPTTLPSPVETQAAPTKPSPGAAPPPPKALENKVRASRFPKIAIGAALALALIGGGAFFLRRNPSLSATPTTSPPAAPITIEALACTDATLSGAGSSPELARAIGIGACARLATEIGVEWNVTQNAPRLQVAASLAPGDAQITLTLQNASESAHAATPLDAINAAVAELSHQFTTPQPSPDKIRAWGARDAESARRIERSWRRLLSHFSPDYEAEVRSLIESDPGSPWPYAFQTMLRGFGERSHAARDKALELAHALPRGRAQAVRGLVLLKSSPARRNEAVELLRRAYDEAPGDRDIAEIFATMAMKLGTADEARAVAERLCARSASSCVSVLAGAITPELDWDLERDRRYLERLRTLLPETWAWRQSLTLLVLLGDGNEARKALEFGDALGLYGGSSVDSAYGQFVRGWLELSLLEPEKARAAVTPLLGDGRLSAASTGAELLIASHVMQGHLLDAASTRLLWMERARKAGDDSRAAGYLVEDLRIRRWLGQEPPPLSELAWAERALLERREASTLLRAFARTELSLARMKIREKGAGKQEAKAALEAIEKMADDESGGERRLRDSILLHTLPLVRVLQGDAAAIERWKTLDRGMFAVKQRMAFDAGLCLEASGERSAAMEAYRTAKLPLAVDEGAFAIVAAGVRLARLYQKGEETKLGAQEEAWVERLWEKADPGVYAGVLNIK